MTESSFCVEAITFTKVSGHSLCARIWLVRQPILTSLECFVQLHWYRVYSSLILLYSSHLEGRQAVELSCSYRYLFVFMHLKVVTANVMLLSISTLIGSFFICMEAGQSTNIVKICTHQKFPVMVRTSLPISHLVGSDLTLLC